MLHGASAVAKIIRNNCKGIKKELKSNRRGRWTAAVASISRRIEMQQRKRCTPGKARNGGSNLVGRMIAVQAKSSARVRFSPRLRIQFSARRHPIFRGGRGRRTSDEYFANEKTRLAFRECGVPWNKDGRTSEPGTIDAFSRPLQDSFGHIICRCRQESEQRLRSSDSEMHGKCIHHSGHHVKP